MTGNTVVLILNRLHLSDAAASIMRLLNGRGPSEARARAEALKKLLQKEDPLVLEIGSHYGWATTEFLRVFRDISIYCFEPDPRNIAVFNARIRDDRCVLVEAAVSNEDGEAELHMSSGWPHVPGWVKALRLKKAYVVLTGSSTASSSIKESVSYSVPHPWLQFKGATRVKTLRLDSWRHEQGITHIDFALMDVQGAERDVIQGASETLKFTDYVQVEYGERATYPGAMDRVETISMMGQHAFELLPEYSSDAETTCGDLLFKNRAPGFQRQ